MRLLALSRATPRYPGTSPSSNCGNSPRTLFAALLLASKVYASLLPRACSIADAGMQIAGRCGNRTMAEQFLYRAQIGAIVHHCRYARMPQLVWVRFQPNAGADFRYYPLDRPR